MSIENKLAQHAEEIPQSVSLKELLTDQSHCSSRLLQFPGFTFDFSRQHITGQILDLLLQLAKEKNLDQKIFDMVTGKQINNTENRPVLHVALRAGAVCPTGI